MKKLTVYLVPLLILLISTACSENNEQPSSPSNQITSDLSANNVNGSISQNGRFGIVGKFYDKSDADKIFGHVRKSVNINVSDLEEAIGKGKTYIFLTIKNGAVVIRDENRKSLSRDSEKLRADELVYFLSKGLIQNLLKTKKTAFQLRKGAADVVSVELRESVLSLTYGETTLEGALPCPPFCGD